MRTLGSLSVLFFAFLLTTACKSTSCCANCTTAQAVVESVAKDNPDCTRLTVHCTVEGGAKACASTSAEKLGKPSDKEDIDAIQTGKTIVLEEGDALDVTVPIHGKDGKFMSACGVTLKSAGMSREQLVAKATTIARTVETRLEGCCDTAGQACCK